LPGVRHFRAGHLDRKADVHRIDDVADPRFLPQQHHGLLRAAGFGHAMQPPAGPNADTQRSTTEAAMSHGAHPGRPRCAMMRASDSCAGSGPAVKDAKAARMVERLGPAGLTACAASILRSTASRRSAASWPST
jgi:hypothetical protein